MWVSIKLCSSGFPKLQLKQFFSSFAYFLPAFNQIAVFLWANITFILLNKPKIFNAIFNFLCICRSMWWDVTLYQNRCQHRMIRFSQLHLVVVVAAAWCLNLVQVKIHRLHLAPRMQGPVTLGHNHHWCHSPRTSINSHHRNNPNNLVVSFHPIHMCLCTVAIMWAVAHKCYPIMGNFGHTEMAKQPAVLAHHLEAHHWCHLGQDSRPTYNSGSNQHCSIEWTPQNKRMNKKRSPLNSKPVLF